MAKPCAAGGNQQRPGKIGYIHDGPVAQHSRQSTLAIQQRDGDQTVAGEQLCAGHDYHGQTEGEEQTAHQAGGPGVGDAVGRGIRGGGTQGDQCSGQKPQQDQL